MFKKVAVAFALFALVACGGSSSTASASPTPSPSPSPAASADPLALYSALEGTYTGTWNNTTYGSSGSINVVVKLDHAAGTITSTLTLGGQVFGAPAPAPETVSFKPSGSLTLDYSGKSAIFGDVTAHFTPSATGATVTIHGANVPSTRVSTFDATGTLTAKTISFTYTVGFRDGTADAHGTATITKQ